MANKVNKTPAVALQGLVERVLLAFGSSVYREFADHALRLNECLTVDGAEPMEKPFPLASYTVATVPTASEWEGSVIYVSNETGGKTLAFSDGTDWRRVQDRAIVS